MSIKMLQDNNAILSILGWIIGSLFVIVLVVGIYSLIIGNITTPIINATTSHQDVSQNAVNRGYAGIDFFGIVIPVVLVFGFIGFLIYRARSIQDD